MKSAVLKRVRNDELPPLPTSGQVGLVELGLSQGRQAGLVLPGSSHGLQAGLVAVGSSQGLHSGLVLPGRQGPKPALAAAVAVCVPTLVRPKRYAASP